MFHACLVSSPSADRCEQRQGSRQLKHRTREQHELRSIGSTRCGCSAQGASVCLWLPVSVLQSARHPREATLGERFGLSCPTNDKWLLRVSLSGTPTCFDLVQSQRQCLLQLRCSRLAHARSSRSKWLSRGPLGPDGRTLGCWFFARLSTENITTFARLVITTTAKDGALEMVLGGLVVDQSNGGLTMNLAINLAVSPLKALMGRG